MQAATPGGIEPLLNSWFVAGFEGSCHRRRDGRRLDLVDSTGHDRLVGRDYTRLKSYGITAARETLRWHRVEVSDGKFDFSVERPRVRAAVRAGITVVWDLCHFGWPDDVDPFGSQFVERYERWAWEVGRFLRRHGGQPAWIVPMNEISFLAWAGGDVAYMNPFGIARGSELKAQLAAAAIAAVDAVRAQLPHARFLHPEPMIHVVPDPTRLVAGSPEMAARANASQFEAWDILSGRTWTLLGGSPRHLDTVGVNCYPANQWVDGVGPMDLSDPRRVPLADQLEEVYARYGRPLIVAETGAEDGLRAAWLRMVRDEVARAVSRGVPVGGICLYPILNHAGWDDDRHCHNGLWDYPDARGDRAVHEPLAAELLAPVDSTGRGARGRAVRTHG